MDVQAVLQQGSPVFLHHVLTHWNWDWGTSPVVFAVTFAQLDGGTARHLFWTAARGDLAVTNFRIDREAHFKAQRYGNIDDLRIFDTIGHRAATSGFATSDFRTQDPSTRVFGKYPSEAQHRDQMVAMIDACHAEGVAPWPVSPVLAQNSGRWITEDDLSPEERVLHKQIELHFEPRRT